MGFIAFSIGDEFRLEQLRKTGRQAFIIGVIQDSVETALNSSADAFFTAVAEFHDRGRIQ